MQEKAPKWPKYWQQKIIAQQSAASKSSASPEADAAGAWQRMIPVDPSEDPCADPSFHRVE
jgi:hypothetical protein